jgi:hypothetical protein
MNNLSFQSDDRMLEKRRKIVVTTDMLEYEVSMATTTTDLADLLPQLTAMLTRGRT